MNLAFDYVEKLALSLMEKHDLLSKDWKFVFDNGRRRLGFCNYKKKTISLSRKFIPLLDDEEIIDIILHEIAHALTGKKTWS
jgi:Zn-dependent protease with chaperone function